jgi:UDP-2-acetamido-3-amino-2,3-dideoxy-glucuronate N-acetyltransferase
MDELFTKKVFRAKVHTETDGSLGVLEFSDAPFRPERFFWLCAIDPIATRASHAHRTCHQLLMCLAGEMTATITSPLGSKLDFRLAIGDILHLEPMMWLDLTNFSPEGVLGVMASEPYDTSEYINDFEELRQLGQATKKS